MDQRPKFEALMMHVDEICRSEWRRRRFAWRRSEAERALIWKGRKAAFAADGPDLPKLHRAGWSDSAHAHCRR